MVMTLCRERRGLILRVDVHSFNKSSIVTTTGLQSAREEEKEDRESKELMGKLVTAVNVSRDKEIKMFIVAFAEIHGIN